MTDLVSSSIQFLKDFPGPLLIALSGGKDSLVCLDLAMRAGHEVRPFSMYLLPGLRCEELTFRAAEAHFGIATRRLQHWCTSDLIWKCAFRAPITDAPVRRVKLSHVVDRARREEGIPDAWCVFGVRKESYHRIQMLKLFAAKSGRDGVHAKPRYLYPIADWKTDDVLRYLTARRIPIPRRIGKTGNVGGSGADLRPESLEFLKAHYPEDYARVIEAFPYAEAQLHRRRFYGHERRY